MNKKVFMAIFAIIGISALFTSCSKEETNESKGIEIIGIWELVSESGSWGRTVTVTELMEFKADKNGSMTTIVEGGWGESTSESYNFKYDFDGENLTIDAKDFTRTTNAYVNGKTLTIEVHENGETFNRQYTKTTEEELRKKEEEKKKKEEENQQEQEAQEMMEKLVGEWIWSIEESDPNAGFDQFNFILKFKDDKSGVSLEQYLLDGSYLLINRAEFNYNVSNGILSLDYDGFIVDYKVSINNDKLILLEISDDPIEITLTKEE